MTEKTYISHSVEETEKIAASICPELKNRRFLCFFGSLGAGKTAFTRGIVKDLAPECLGLVHSPTFAIVNEYLGKDVQIFHFDLYRIKDEDDLYSTGFYDYLDAGAVLVVEWSENIEGALPPDAVRLHISAPDEYTRVIERE